MKKLMMALGMAAMLAGCTGMTEAERTALRDTGYLAAKVTIETLHSLDIATLDASPEVRQIASLACNLLEIGGPVLVLAINSAAEDMAEPVTPEEYSAALDQACILLAALLEPAPVDEPAPAPEA